LLIKLDRTFNETLNCLLGNGKRAWAKVIAQKLKPPLDFTDNVFSGCFSNCNPFSVWFTTRTAFLSFQWLGASTTISSI
jgi:hypothetical protein